MRPHHAAGALATALVAALPFGACSGTSTPSGGTTTPGLEAGAGDARAPADGGGADGVTPGDSAAACGTDANIATIDAGPSWAWHQLACAAEMTACATDCSCNSAILSALACGGSSATCLTGAFTALASDPAVTSLANCFATNPCTMAADSGPDSMTADAGGGCRAGEYRGAFGGLYSSHLTVFGANIPLVGTVDLILNPAGSAGTTCALGAASEDCSNVLTMKGGTVTGTMDGLFPYFCSLSGALDCATGKLADGWMECTYCIGPLDDGGMACSIAGSDGATGTGGKFSGPITADYFSTSTGGDGGAGALDGGGSGPPAFGTVPPPVGGNPGAYEPGIWNGAESLAGYPGTGPLPDGGTLGDYLSDAGYGQIGVTNDFGGNGWWYATYQHP